MEAEKQEKNISDGLAELLLVHCGWMACEKGHIYGPAIRDHYLIHYIESGCGQFIRGEERISLGAGDCFLIYPEEITTYQASKNDPWKYYWVGFDGAIAKRILNMTTLTKKDSTFYCVEEKEVIIACIKEMYACAKLPNGGMVKALGLLMELLSHVVDSCPIEKKATIGSAQREYLRKALVYIQENYSATISVSNIAQQIGIDRSYLYRIFSEQFNVGVVEYINQMRLEEVCRMLAETDKSISQIAMDTGFSSSSHMSYKFKQAKKETPSSYRKKTITKI